LIINPPSPKFIKNEEKRLLLGPLYLLSALRNVGHEISYIDSEVEKINIGAKYALLEYIKDVKQRIVRFAPDVVGLSLHFSGILESALEVAGVVKEISREIVTVMGGHHPTIFPQNILREHENVDFILKAESEATLVQLLDCLEHKSDYSGIDGLVFRRDGIIVENPKRGFIENVDDLPMPAYDMVDFKDYHFDTSRWFNPKGHQINFSIPLLTSRSCPNRCSFCSMYLMHGQSYRMRSANSVVDEIEYLYHTYGQRYFSITDDNFTLNKGRILKMAEEVKKRKLDFQFDAVNGIAMNTLDAEVMDALVSMGFIRTFFAVESGSEFIRVKAMRKKLSQKKVYEVFDLVRDYPQIRYTVLFIIGFPEETEESLQETYDLIKKYDFKKVAIGFAIPYPGTQLFEQAVRDGLLTVPLEKLHEFPALYNFSKEPLLRPYNLAPAKLVAFRERAYQEVNLKYNQSTNY
jgi:radical SAM superfamily enzyme YgiQ (UPF0313 family)